MTILTLKAIVHRNQEWMGIYFTNDKALHMLVRKIPFVKWSQTHKCWYLPLCKESVTAITTTAGNSAVIDTSGLRAYLLKKQAVAATLPGAVKSTVAQKTLLPTAPVYKPGKENLTALNQFIELLKLKAYSPSTITTYRSGFLQLLQLLQQKPVHSLALPILSGTWCMRWKRKVLVKIQPTAG